MESEPYTEQSEVLKGVDEIVSDLKENFKSDENTLEEGIPIVEGMDPVIDSKEKLVDRLDYIKNKLGVDKIKNMFDKLSGKSLSEEDRKEILLLQEKSFKEQIEYLKNRYNDVKKYAKSDIGFKQKAEAIMYELKKSERLLEYITTPTIAFVVILIIMGGLIIELYKKESYAEKRVENINLKSTPPIQIDGSIKRDKYNNKTLRRINIFDPMLYNDTKRFGNNSRKRRL